MFHFGGLGALFGGISPPVATGLNPLPVKPERTNLFSNYKLRTGLMYHCAKPQIAKECIVRQFSWLGNVTC